MPIFAAFLMLVGVGAAENLQTTPKQKAVIELKSFEKQAIKDFEKRLKISHRMGQD